MSRWFRMYADAMRNPKVARLSDWEFRAWVELLAVASENDGIIPSADDLKHLLKRRLDHVLRALNALIRAGLIDALGDGYCPHNWQKRQYKSDTSTERVRKFREKRNVSETPPDTETEYTVAKATDAAASSDKVFWENAKAFLGGPSKGSLIGKWVRDFGRPETAAAITAAQLERPADPASYVAGILKRGKSNASAFAGPC